SGGFVLLGAPGLAMGRARAHRGLRTTRTRSIAMRRSSRVVLLVPPLLALGRGGGGAGGASGQDTRINAATANGPHGGPALPLPGNKGYGEVLVEGGGSSTGRLVVFFVGPDLKAPLNPLPSSVSA